MKLPGLSFPSQQPGDTHMWDIVHPPFTSVLTCELRRRRPLEELRTPSSLLLLMPPSSLSNSGLLLRPPAPPLLMSPPQLSQSHLMTLMEVECRWGPGVGGWWCWRLIFTLDSPSSPLDCRVYLPTQLASAEDRQTDNERWGGGSAARGMEGGGGGGGISSDCL